MISWYRNISVWLTNSFHWYLRSYVLPSGITACSCCKYGTAEHLTKWPRPVQYLVGYDYSYQHIHQVRDQEYWGNIPQTRFPNCWRPVSLLKISPCDYLKWSKTPLLYYVIWNGAKGGVKNNYLYDRGPEAVSRWPFLRGYRSSPSQSHFHLYLLPKPDKD